MAIPFAQEPALKETRYPVTLEDFPNPERGWYHYRELSNNVDLAVRGQNNSSLVFLKIRADAFKAAPLSTTLLDQLQKAFDQARQNGVKVIPRVAYNDGPGDGCNPYGCDAPKAIILQHIAQLTPLWKKNKDVIDLIDPGFIGGWGEWHSSSNGLDNTRDKTDILFAILDSLPADRMAYVRTPADKRSIFGGSPTSTAQVLGSDRAFNKSRIARVGHLNDCFLSGPDDVGTYGNTANGWPRSREVDYIGGESRFTPYGGETCALDPVGVCVGALQEMAALHIDHLNHDYHPDVINRWGSQGCLDTINLRLGHRLALDRANLPDSVKPGGILRLRFVIRNLGFGELFNPREVQAVLYRPGSRLDAAVLPVDPRTWSGGTADSLDVSLAVPVGLPEGSWRLGLRLGDKDSSLRGDPRYAVRFANAGVWNADSGVNDLKTNLVVSSQAPGSVNPSFNVFQVVGTVPVGPDGAKKSREAFRSRARLVPVLFPDRVFGFMRLFSLDGKAVSDVRRPPAGIYLAKPRLETP